LAHAVKQADGYISANAFAGSQNSPPNDWMKTATRDKKADMMSAFLLAYIKQT